MKDRKDQINNQPPVDNSNGPHNRDFYSMLMGNFFPMAQGLIKDGLDSVWFDRSNKMLLSSDKPNFIDLVGGCWRMLDEMTTRHDGVALYREQLVEEGKYWLIKMIEYSQYQDRLGEFGIGEDGNIEPANLNIEGLVDCIGDCVLVRVLTICQATQEGRQHVNEYLERLFDVQIARNRERMTSTFRTNLPETDPDYSQCYRNSWDSFDQQ